MSTGMYGRSVIFLGFLKMIKLLVIYIYIHIQKKKTLEKKHQTLNHAYFGPNCIFWGEEYKGARAKYGLDTNITRVVRY